MLSAPRDIILISVGMGEQPEGRRALEPLGARSPMHGVDSYRAVFWVPLPDGHKKATKDESRASAVPDVTPAELQRIRDGVVEEIVLEWGCRKDAPEEWRRRAVEQAWWNLAKNRATGFVPRKPLVTVAQPNGGAHGPELIAARDFANRRLVAGGL